MYHIQRSGWFWPGCNGLDFDPLLGQSNAHSGNFTTIFPNFKIWILKKNYISDLKLQTYLYIQEVKSAAVQAVTNITLWYSDPGELNNMQYWSENHQSENLYSWFCQVIFAFLIIQENFLRGKKFVVRSSKTLLMACVRQSLLSATLPSKLINGCQGHPPLCLSPGTAQRQRNPEVKLLNAQHFIQLTFVDSCSWHKVRKSGWSLKTEMIRLQYYDLCIMTLFTHYGINFRLELAYAFHTMKIYTNLMWQSACFSLTFDLQLLSEL